MIPKIIHYCWFGHNPKPDIIQKCMASWKKFCPDYEIKEWNEENWDVNKYPYSAEAYQNKQWAFVADIAKLDIAANIEGGVFLDTDVEMRQSWDNLLNSNSFFFFETGRFVTQGLGFGATEGNELVSSMLQEYNGLHFIVNGKIEIITCNHFNTQGVMNFDSSFQRNNQTQTLTNDNHIYSSQVYSQYAMTYYTGLWNQEKVNNFDDNKTIKRNNYKNNIFKKYLRSPKIFSWIEKYLGNRCLKYYTIAVYDIIDNGIFFYLKKLLNKLK